MSIIKSDHFTFAKLVDSIQDVHQSLSIQASKAINISLTTRNWLIGAYIAEFQLRGSDRAKYGESLFLELSKHLKKQKVSTCGQRQLYNYVTFYREYPEILRTVSAQFQPMFPPANEEEKKVRTVSAKLQIEPEKLINRFSYSHFEQLIEIDDPVKRGFYEIECLKTGWSVRELKRQIAS